MNTVEIESTRAPRAWYAAKDAAIKSYAASTHFSNAQRLEVDRVRLVLDMAYSGKVYVNYRKKFAVVKIENARVQDPKLLKELEQEYETRGYTKVVSKQGVLYRIPKTA